MNYIDIIIAILLSYGLIQGFSNGLIKEVTGLVGLIIGVFVAIKFSSYLDPKIGEMIKGYQEFIPLISFVILFVVSVFSIRLLGHVLERFTNALSLGVISKFMGSIFGVLKFIVILTFLLFIAHEHDLINKKIEKNSVLLDPLKKAADIIHPEINKHTEILLEKVEKETEKVKEKLEEINSQQQ